MRIHFLDVGKGDCTVIEFPDGSFMIVDGGDEREETRLRILGYCRALGVDTFDVAVLTHADSDHAGGLDDAIDCFGAKTVYVPSSEGEDTVLRKVLSAAENAGAEIRVSRMYEADIAGMRENYWYWMMLSPLSPEAAESSSRPPEADPNDASAVLYFAYAGRRFLMTGDISSAEEDRLADAFTATEGLAFEREILAPWGKEVLRPDLEEIDFLKAGHHGSGGSTGEMLAGLCRPLAYFISCGAGNAYGHPSLSSIGNILSANPEAQIWRTDELGCVMLTIRAGGSFSVYSERG